MNWQRKLGPALVAAGVLLCCCYLVPTVYGSAMSHLAVAEFRAQGHGNRLWDSARIRAYRQTLGVTMGPAEAVLRVPKVGIEVPVYEGSSTLVMNRGAGHITGTAMPGRGGNLVGNIAIAGHRDGFFRGLKDLVPGDLIQLEYPQPGTSVSGTRTAERTDIYVVRKIGVVSPSDSFVLNPTDKSTLTLVTCYPFYYVGPAPERYIVQAALLSGKTGPS